MDDLVLRGMARWPNVPAVYGWLALNRRGEWLIKGDPIRNEAITAFIARNYEPDAQGRWYFQNGPQRVFVALDYTPFVLRTAPSGGPALALQAHTGAPVNVLNGVWLDEDFTVILDSDAGVGLVDDRDLDRIATAFADASGNPLDEDAVAAAIDRLQAGDDPALYLEYAGSRVKVGPIQSADVPRRFAFDPRPVAPTGHPESA